MYVCLYVNVTMAEFLPSSILKHERISVEHIHLPLLCTKAYVTSLSITLPFTQQVLEGARSLKRIITLRESLKLAKLL